MKTIKKRCNVVMLPTKDNTSNLLRWDNRTDNHKHHTYQHLYITSNDEIKEDDNCILDKKKIIKIKEIKSRDFSNTTKVVVDTKNLTHSLELCKKIIATTDKSLFIVFKTPFGQINHLNNEYNGVIMQREGKHYINLPQPSQPFIKKYSELGGIDKVLVEYKYYTDNKTSILDNILILKVNSQNEITIHTIKDKWTREEVKELCDLYESIIHEDFHVMKKEDMYTRIKEIKS